MSFRVFKALDLLCRVQGLEKSLGQGLDFAGLGLVSPDFQG